MRRTLSFALLISLTLATTIYANTYTVSTNSELSEVYTANMDTGILTINWGNETKVFSDMVGHTGQASRTLVPFNGGPALSYENSGSNTHFEVFYTLTLREKVPFIDCVYGNIRNGQNGVSIRKAVCNLQKPLSSNYQDLIFTYSDNWIEASNTVSLQSVMTEPSEAADAPLGQLGEVYVALRYDSVEELMSATPKTIATVGAKNHEVTIGNAYLVYEADGITPLALDIETDPATHSLKRLTPTELLLAVEAD
ncbi:hypothetical protein [Stutzerimonas azotifigens]|uniref:Uncharacterized protein n=1 Tax=Stutzerimonas azotifigens TaxID=291995 RepID=A0ABR5Z449_9GAMM|nr:hypothetical protein [Stutzerimonas azotifigens]MBA1274938.1 hypothetical protein [Stutzerimonas azotifigens]